MSDEKNPYLEMPKDVLEQHLKQLSEAVKGKEIDVAQTFSIPTVSEEDKEKIEEHPSLTKKVKELSEAASSKDLDENSLKLANATLTRTVNDIKKIDPDVPLGSVLDSKFNSLDKLEILSSVEGLVNHYSSQIATIKKELSSDKGTTEGTQTYSAPKDQDSVENIFKEYTKEDK